MIDKVTKEREKYYEDRRPEITNTVLMRNLPLSYLIMMTFGQYQYSRLKKDESSTGSGIETIHYYSRSKKRYSLKMNIA